MRLVFAGTPEPAVVALEALLASEHDVVAVLTRPDARRGRGRSLQPSPVAQCALEHGIEVLRPTSLKPDTDDGVEIRQRLEELAPDCIPVVAYGNLITPDLLDIAPHGWVNLHFSLLPQWRGAAPVQAAIKAGQSSTGVSTFRIDEGLDTGPVIDMREYAIEGTDTADDLLTRLAYRGAELLVDTMDQLGLGTAVLRAQSGEASYAPKITKEDARIDWHQSTKAIDCAIRAHTPAPGAWTLLGDQRFKIGPVIPAQEPGLEPGLIKTTKSAVFVGTGDGAVRLGSLQAPGKKMVAAEDFARGTDIDGMRFS